MVVQKGGDLFIRERLLRDQLWTMGIMDPQVGKVQVNLNFSQDVCANMRKRKEDLIFQLTSYETVHVQGIELAVPEIRF